MAGGNKQASRIIHLGDEIEDVTSKTSGICIAKIEYLNGSMAYLIQPYTTDDNARLPSIEAPAEYCKRVGDGLYIKPKPPMGFNAANMQG